MLSFLTTTKQRKSPWNAHTTTVSNGLREKLFLDGKDSLWLSVIHKKGSDTSENGMIHYNHKSDEIINIIEYPSTIEPFNHCCVPYQQRIYIVEGQDREIIAFNTKSHSFTKKATIPMLGTHPNSVCVFNKIHIFHGSANECHYLIYDPESDNVIDRQVHTHKIRGVVVLLYQNRIITIGGFDVTADNYLDTFSMSSTIKQNEVDNVPNFNIIQKWKLPMPLYRFGHIIFQNYLLIFGGFTTGKKFVDSIYILDLNNDNEGWKELKHIKCPIPSQYSAVLTNEMNVHLFAGYNNVIVSKSQRGHYSLPIRTVLGSQYIILNANKDKDDNKCGECDELQSKLNTVMTEKESLQTLVNELLQNQTESEFNQKRLMQQNQSYQTRVAEIENDKNEYIDKYHQSKALNLKLGKEKNEYIEKYEQSMQQVE